MYHSDIHEDIQYTIHEGPKLCIFEFNYIGDISSILVSMFSCETKTISNPN